MKGEKRSKRSSKCHRVLVVDDDEDAVEVLTAALEADGHEVSHAPGLEQALVLLAKSVFFATVPDIIFVNLLLSRPPLSEFAAKVRGLPNPHPWLVGMSATAPQPAEQGNFDELLLKPETLDRIRGAVDNVERMTPARSAPHRTHDGRPIPPARPLVAVVDPNVFSNLRKTTSTVLLHQLYKTCIEDTRGRISALRELAALEEIERVRQLAHEIKGSAALVGASQLFSLAESIELGSYNKDAMPGRLNEMDAACARIHRMLRSGFLDA